MDAQMKTIPVLTIFVVVLSLCSTAATYAWMPETVPVGNTGNIGQTQYLPHNRHVQDQAREAVCGPFHPFPCDFEYAKGTFGAVGYHYRIGTTEVTNAQYTDFLNAVAETDTHALFNTEMSITQTGSNGSFSYTALEGLEQHPVTYVSFWDAARYTNWLHNGQPTGDQGLNTTEDGAYPLNHVTHPTKSANIKRQADALWFIPSENEWYKAAYHKNDGDTDNYSDWPTGSHKSPTNEAPPGGPNSANYDFFELLDDFTVLGPHPEDWEWTTSFLPQNNTTPVGAYLNSASPYGTFDQCGNVHEWVETITDIGKTRVLGGDRNGGYPGLPESSGWPSFKSHFESGNIGFRVARVPEPSSLLLGAVAGVGILARRRRRS